MGTRLYPLTDIKEFLEILADVPAGTSLKLASIERECGDNYQRLYDTLDSHPDCGKLRQFTVFGWGRVQFPITECAGEEKSPARCRTMLDAQGVSWPYGMSNDQMMALLGGGLHWS